MIRIKTCGKKKPVNEFLGGLFSRKSSTSSKKAQMGAKDSRETQEFIKSIDQKLGSQKLKSLGLSLVDLYNQIDDATKVFSGGKGILKYLSSKNTNIVINFLKQNYDDVVKAVQDKKLTPQEANDVILGITKIAGAYNSIVPSMMEEGNDELNEAFGRQKLAIRSFIQSLKMFNPDGSLADQKAAGQQPIATSSATAAAPASASAQSAKTATPPPPPKDDEQAPTKRIPIFKANKESGGDVLSMRLKQVLNNYPALKSLNKDAYLTSLLKMISNQLKANDLSISEAKGDNLAAQLGGFKSKTATGLKRGAEGPIAPGAAGTAANIQKGSIDVFGPAVMLLKQNNIDQKNAVIIANKIKDIVGLHLKKYGVNLPHKRAVMPKPKKPAAPAKPPESAPVEKPEVKGVTPDAKAADDIADAFKESKKLNEHLIEKKNNEIFNEKDAKRFKLLAGLL